MPQCMADTQILKPNMVNMRAIEDERMPKLVPRPNSIPVTPFAVSGLVLTTLSRLVARAKGSTGRRHRLRV